jgi:serine/threonine protein kinase/Tol biopolymer transport system component
MVGQTISHYLLLETLGAGSMGVVYKARDTLLDRSVALKVLRPEKVADPQRRERFIREAKAASAFNHPNIVTIHEIGEIDGVHFLCMEWVRGRTLADLIRRRHLPVDQALAYAVQIADALATAHGGGIVHRDLKPANIMVSDEGLVKVLDFGLAKLAQPPDPDQSTETVETTAGNGPRAAPEPRFIEGTPAYMSPEQAAAEKVDARTDIFSFGAVLYEMVTGQRAFQTVSQGPRVPKMIHTEPKSASRVVPSVPREIDRIIGVCLHTDVRRRFQHIDDVHVVLRDLKEEYEAGRLKPVETSSELKPGARGLKIYIAAGALFAVALALSLWWWVQHRTPATPSVLRRLTWDLGVSTDPTLSVNSELLAYASDRGGEGNLDIWVRHALGGEAIRLTHHPADEREPAFSPDSSRIAFRSERDQGGIYVVPTFGGAERLVASQGRRPRFSPDGKWIAYWVRDLETNWGKIYIVQAAGGSARPVRPEFPDAHAPIWSPDGKRLLICGTSEIKPPTEDLHDWWIVDLERGSVVRAGAFAAFRRHGLPFNHAPGGWFGNQIVFASRVGDSRNLWRIGIRNGPITGDPERLTFGTGAEIRPFATGDGHIVFSSGAVNTGLWGVPIHSDRGKVNGQARPLVHAAGTANSKPSLSEDGRRVTFVSDREGHDEIFVQEFETGKEIALTATSPEELAAIRAGTLAYGLQPDWPVMSRDGARVAYWVLQAPATTREGIRKQSIYVAPTGGAAPEKVCDDCGRPTGWSADGRRILFIGPTVRSTIAVFHLASGRNVHILSHPIYSLHEARFSPDDRWIAFRANTGQERMRVYIAPYRETPTQESDWILVTDGRGEDSIPQWSPDGNLLYYFSNLDGSLSIRARHLAPETKRPTGEPFVVYRFADARHPPSNRFLFSVSRDKMVFSLDELTSNIWMANLPKQN